VVCGGPSRKRWSSLSLEDRGELQAVVENRLLFDGS
jgi:hypothetical protein